TDLVDADRLVLAEPPVGSERLLLEEVADGVPRLEEVLVARACLLVRAEDRDRLRLERIHERARPRDHLVARPRVDDPWHHEESVALPSGPIESDLIGRVVADRLQEPLLLDRHGLSPTTRRSPGEWARP